MQFLYNLLIFILVVSAIIAVLMAAGVLHIEVHTDSNPDNLSDDFLKRTDNEKEEGNNE